MIKAHSFHIPVMGIAYTIDTPLKVSHFGIDSVISLVDDILLEKLRKMYSKKFEISYKEITNKIDDFRAKRITSYLNMINELTEKKFDEIKESALKTKNDIIEYLSYFPDNSYIKEQFHKLTETKFNLTDVSNWLKENLTRGSIDVNIMTKIDKENYKDNIKLPREYNDGSAALRGYAQSDLSSSLILSAGFNPKLYNYLTEFDDFYPNKNGFIKKKITLKVSDFRSALIQGKFLAKKGIWVSEYRIESGLNCGGHAFATEGFLLGPILDEVKIRKQDLINTAHELFVKALKTQNRNIPKEVLPIKITVQGGVGTSEEHNFLLDYYNIDSVGWGTPFLLVPEATTVDKDTINQLIKAKEKDLYLSNISPLGVPFNSLRENTKDVEKENLIKKGRPGSNCPKKFISNNIEFTEKAICKASFKYQRLKIKELNAKELPKTQYINEYNKIVEKSCICVGLGTSALIKNNIDYSVEGKGVSICPGPNMAYYNKTMTLKQMVNHIYNKNNESLSKNRPNMFIKELNLYLDYLKNKIDENKTDYTKAQEIVIERFINNLQLGIEYYNNLFSTIIGAFSDSKNNIINELKNSSNVLNNITIEFNANKMANINLL